MSRSLIVSVRSLGLVSTRPSGTSGVAGSEVSAAPGEHRPFHPTSHCVVFTKPEVELRSLPPPVVCGGTDRAVVTLLGKWSVRGGVQGTWIDKSRNLRV